MQSKLNSEATALNWLIPELLPRGETVLLTGQPFEGKTLLAIDAAFAIANGKSNFLGQQVSQGKVLLVSVKDSEQCTPASGLSDV